MSCDSTIGVISEKVRDPLIIQHLGMEVIKYGFLEVVWLVYLVYSALDTAVNTI